MTSYQPLFIRLGDRGVIRTSAVTAVRPLDARPGMSPVSPPHKPSVAIDYMDGDASKTLYLECETDTERDALAEYISLELLNIPIGI